MDYEKKYKDAFERAKENYHAGCLVPALLEYIFPELKESENEKIKKEIAWLESKSTPKQNEPSNDANNIKPKFHEGEWIVFNGLTLLINETVQGYYRTTSIEGIRNSYDWDIDNAARLWTIEDAKDGDILCTYECDEPKIIFTLKGTPKKHYALRYYSYYNIMYPHLEPHSDGGCLAPKEEDVKPATKEQRDILLQKLRKIKDLLTLK
jgi:hypothetical protein